MILDFVTKDPDKAYIADRLWIPKSKVRVSSLKNALEFVVPSKDGQMKMVMWDETTHHLICPREFIHPSTYPRYKFDFVDLRPTFNRVEFRDLVKPRDADQERAWTALAANDNGILNLGCGKGKTKLAVKKIAQRGVPALVVCPDGGILSQWKESIYGNQKKGILPGLEFDGELGIIQGPVFDWARPVTLALVTTLWMRIADGAVPEELFRYFGLIIYDEVHIIGAPKFSMTATPFYGDRLGLTATLQREDGLDPIYRYHIGEPFYSDLTTDLKPRIYFEKTPAVIDSEPARMKKTGTINASMLRGILGRDLKANTYRYWRIKQALATGRKILALSHSKDQLRLFKAMFPEAALLIGETPQDERMELLRSNQLTLSISKLGTTGVDDDQLDTLFYLTPYTSRNAAQQSLGRIQRRRAGKKTPVGVMFEEHTNPTFRRMCQKLKQLFRGWDYKFDVTNPDKTVPLTLPPEVQARYDDAFKQLPSQLDVVEDEGTE